MKKTIQFLFIMIILLDCRIIFAAEHEDIIRSPLSQIKKIMEAPPPDILKKTLNEAQEQLETQKPKTDEADDDESNAKSPNVLFKNPFIPQLPQEAKIAKLPDTQGDQNPNNTTPAPAAVPQFTVSGVIWNTKKPQAIINGQIVAVGDQISNWQVAEISRDGVRVTYDTQNLWVKPVVNPEQSGSAQQPRPPIKINPYIRR